MKTMILAAGRGERMRPLTDTLPKPLLPCGKDSLIGWHLRRLKNEGIEHIVINHAWLGHKIEATLGNGSAYGLNIQYSPEGAVGLETAGGIAQALPLLGDAPFLVINGDILTDFNPSDAIQRAANLPPHIQAHLYLVPNPSHNPNGDFALNPDGSIGNNTQHRHTFSGIGIYRPELFATIQRGQAAKLAPLLRQAAEQGQISGSLLSGLWLDVGTPERLQQAAALTQNWT